MPIQDFKGQLTFPSTAVPSADPNTLDDYEEGTFVVGFSIGGGSITIHNSVKTLSYTKIGRSVTITGYVTVSSVSNPTGACTIGPLPFIPMAGTQGSAFTAVTLAVQGNMEATAATSLQGVIPAGLSAIYIGHFAAGVYSPGAADFKAGTELVIGATYFSHQGDIS